MPPVMRSILFLGCLLIFCEQQALSQPVCTHPELHGSAAALDGLMDAWDQHDYSHVLELLDSAEAEFGQHVLFEFYRGSALASLDDDRAALRVLNDFLRHLGACPPEECEEYEGHKGVAEDLIAAIMNSSEVASINPGVGELSGGAALLMSGLIFDLASLEIGDELDEARSARDMEAFNAAADDARRARIVEGVLYGAGAAAALTGLLLMILLDDEVESSDSEEEGTTAFQISPAGFSVIWLF